MRYPEFLKPGGTIGFVAPSFGCTTQPYVSRFENARKRFDELGYKMEIGANCNLNEGIGISNTPEKCGEELNSFYKSDKNDVLMSVGGGELMNEVVPFIDFQGIKECKPKWYMGYSDNTNFIFPSVTLADTAAIYAPCAGDFGMEKWHPAVGDALDLITGKKLTFENYDKWELELPEDADDLCSYYVTQPNKMKAYAALDGQSTSAGLYDGSSVEKEISFEGRLIGGCLDCLANLVGTKFDGAKDFSEKYKDDGIIWFFEACDLNVYSIRRAIWNLREAGWFSHVKGFLIGRPGAAFGQELFGLDQYNAVTDMLASFNVPILMDLDIGHHPPMIPLLCGAVTKVSFKQNKLTVSYQLR
ncbi:S66 family peptidase [Butyrivibrio sp. YAB3001]|uniref:S66 family peptidase n=1 Tax=Butyrivibrio sp. YAB3001 TaxID=1520812 RepID=UPI0008F61B4C|nr:S66 peptidase family protein [Butyrivibrio sp. YAB3001]SFB87749.1 Muramoyltetrapeptide carboxypeptidase LdcA (peptidoglycan recycling) [Butyrivibrio sp. YAB3001]